MPDMTMCLNQSCKSKENCYRFIAKATPNYQAYSYFGAENNEICDYFYELETRQQILTKLSPEDRDEYIFIEALLKGKINVQR